MGQNRDTPNPSPLSLAAAMSEAEAAMADIGAIYALMSAVAGCNFTIEPEALYPLRDAVKAAQDRLDQAWKSLFPVLCAARAASAAQVTP